MSLVKLNLSGHKNDLLDQMGFIFPGTLQVTDINDPLLPEKITELLKPLVDSGDTVVLVPPGFAPLASIVLAIVHGLTGHFPQIICLVKDPSGSFIPSKKINLQDIRNNVRVSRDNVISL